MTRGTTRSPRARQGGSRRCSSVGVDTRVTTGTHRRVVRSSFTALKALGLSVLLLCSSVFVRETCNWNPTGRGLSDPLPSLSDGGRLPRAFSWLHSAWVFRAGQHPIAGMFVDPSPLKDTVPAPKSLALLTVGSFCVDWIFIPTVTRWESRHHGCTPVWLRLPGEAELEEGPCPRWWWLRVGPARGQPSGPWLHSQTGIWFQERRQREERPSPCCLGGWTSVRRLHPPPLTGSQGRVSCGCGERSRSQGDSALVQCLLGSDSSALVPLLRCRAVRRSSWVSMNGCPWAKRTDSRRKDFGC